MHAEPQQEHEWLTQLLGEWSYESECDMGPDQPRENFAGTERVYALGPFWVLAEATGTMPGGGPAEMRTTLGFEPGKGYVGTWIGSMMPMLWVYAGTLSEDGRTLTLAAEGPSMAGDGTTASYEDIVEIVSPTERTMTSRVLGADGTWREFVWVRYRKA